MISQIRLLHDGPSAIFSAWQYLVILKRETKSGFHWGSFWSRLEFLFQNLFSIAFLIHPRVQTHFFPGKKQDFSMLEEKSCFSTSCACGDDNSIHFHWFSATVLEGVGKNPQGEFSSGGTAIEIPAEYTAQQWTPAVSPPLIGMAWGFAQNTGTLPTSAVD